MPNWDILYNPVAFGKKLNDKRDDTQTHLPYWKEDRRRLQSLMDYGYDRDPMEGRTERGLSRGFAAATGRNTEEYDAQRAVNRPKYGPYSEAAQLGADPRAGEINANLARQLAMAEGRGPSLAEQQYRTAQQENVAAQASLAAGGRGAQGQRFAAQNIARSQAGLASGVAEARTREQMAAQSAYNQSIQSAQGADAERAALNAQLQQQTGQANQQAYMTLLAQQLGLSEAELRARMQNVQQPSFGDRLTSGISGGLAGYGGT